MLYEDIVGYLEALGLERQIEEFFSIRDVAPSVQGIQSSFDHQY